MGRGEHPRQNHHKIIGHIDHNNVILGSRNTQAIKKIKAYGQLVLLDLAVTNFTSVAYQRHRL